MGTTSGRTNARIRTGRLLTMVAGWLMCLTTGSRVFAQAPGAGPLIVQAPDDGAGVAISIKGPMKESAPVLGAPYLATITIQSVQTLADGNHIVQKTTGSVARDSSGRIRQQMALPAIGNLSAANAPEMVFIQDPVAQVSYALNLTDKTAHTLPLMPGPGAMGGPGVMIAGAGGPGPGPLGPLGPGGGPARLIITGGPMGPGGPLADAPSKDVLFMQKGLMSGENNPTQATSVDLGSQTIEGVVANGIRTTVTIPAGQIGNEQPLDTVTEVWTSPDLKVVVSSKRSDPRTGEQTFQLTGIQRSEPDASLFTVPPDFTLVSGPPQIVYGVK